MDPVTIAEPEAPTRTAVGVLPDIGLELIKDIDSAQACQIDSCLSAIDEPCPNEAKWLVLFRDHCLHGGVVKPGDPLVCQIHKEVLAGANGLACGACGCNLVECEGWRHLIAAFQEI